MSKYRGTSGTDQEIINTIGYITDDRYIASYYGVDVRRVNQLRSKVEKPKEDKAEAVLPEVEHATTAKPKKSSAGLNSDSERKWNKNAKEGSAQLLKALLKFFANREHRIIGHAREGPPGHAPIHSDRHQKRERDGDGDRAQRQPQIVGQRALEHGV